MKQALHADGFDDHLRKLAERGDNPQLKLHEHFSCLVNRLCRKRGLLEKWRVALAWRRLCRRHDKSRTLWIGQYRLLVGIMLIGMLGACREQPLQTRKSPPEKSGISTVPGTWPPRGYKRVVAHRFQDTAIESFSMIEGGRVDASRLESLSLAEAELDEDQIERLLDGTFNKEHQLQPAACYDPHHIFLFFDAEDRVVNAIEICFGCTNISTIPELTEGQWYRHDFRSLARLCEEIGIGLHETDSAEDFSKILDEREGR